MVKVYNRGVYLARHQEILVDTQENREKIKHMGLEGALPNAPQATITHGILAAHNVLESDTQLQLKFDAMASHDITFVGIIQTAKVSGLEQFPLPYVLTNCHNSLCAVGGTINEDDHLFGLTAAKRYGGIYVPPHMAVIHAFVRETMAGCGKMILGSDSHTRYGALGTLGVGEGGGELVKQLLNQTYDMDYPRVVAVYLAGKPQPGVGPQDVALAIIGAVFNQGLAKNSVLEFVGEGIAHLSADYRCGIDVMTTETTCWSSIWQTDEVIKDYLALHCREQDYQTLVPGDLAYYDGLIRVDLDQIKPMIALPFHPSNTFEIDTLNQNLGDILRQVEKEALDILENPAVPLKLTHKIEQGRLRIDQGVIAGCAGGIYNNLMATAAILQGNSTGSGVFSLSVYPASQPVLLELTRNGAATRFIEAGAILRTAFCGPCFGAGDVPANQGLSIRHTTRNFPNREGSKPMDGQISSVALMDARSIAATAINGGYLTPATALATDRLEAVDRSAEVSAYHYDDTPYQNRVYYGVGKPQAGVDIQYGPNIVDWPQIQPLAENLLIKVVAYITDPVTTTDEIIPSGETSSFRSNPIGLAEYTFSRKDPAYVGRAKAVFRAELARQSMLTKEAEAPAANASERAQSPEVLAEGSAALTEVSKVLDQVRGIAGMENLEWKNVSIGSAVFAVKPGDGSAREQAASCQRVLGGSANFANEYATKRYRSNLINWGMIPFLIQEKPVFENGDYIFVPQSIQAILGDTSQISAYVLHSNQTVTPITLSVAPLTPTEKEIIRDGCLINYNRNQIQN